MRFLKLVLFIPIFISLNCCQPHLINLSTAKEKIIQYYESGEFDKEISAAIEEAEEKFNAVTYGDSAVVIFDVDDTALSGYGINKKLDFGYVVELWNKWIEEEDAPAIKPVKELYDFLLGKGCRIIFITGRDSNQYAATKRNLVNSGYTTFDTLITRHTNEMGMDALEYKSNKRTDLYNRGYIIAGTVGDQWSDLEGPHHGIQVKVPNYVYLVE